MIGIHLCGGSVQDIAVFSPAEKCATEETNPPCHMHQSMPCCQDQAVVHQGQELKTDITKIQLQPLVPVEVVQPLVLLSEVIPGSPLARIKFFNYDTPLRSFDLTVEHQSFLI